MNMPKQGILTMANDVTVDWLACLLGGLRRTGCTLPIAITPYDNRLTKVKRLISRYSNVSIFYPDNYEDLVNLGNLISGPRYFSRCFLKLSVFWGPFDQFAYFDTDIVLTQRPEDWLSAYAGKSKQRLAILADPSPEYVFRGKLLDEFTKAHRPACNAGFLIASRGVINYEDVYRVASEMPAHMQDDFFPEFGDQSFLNYLLYACGVEVELICDLVKDVSASTWAPQHVVKAAGGSLEYAKGKKPQSEINNNAVTGPAFLHWAGLKLSPSMANFHLFLEDALPAMSWPGRLLLIINLLRVAPIPLLSRTPLVLKRLLMSTRRPGKSF